MATLVKRKLTVMTRASLTPFFFLLAAVMPGVLTACGHASTAQPLAPQPDLDPAVHVESEASEKHACDLRVFSGPGSVVIVENAEGQREEGKGANGVLFHISEQRGDRLYYDSVEFLDSDAAAPAAGWLSIADVAVNLNMSEVSPALMPPRPIPLYSTHSAAASVVQTYLQEAVTTKVLGCHDDWAHVRVDNAGESHEGWLRAGDHCGNPVTVCNELPAEIAP